MSQYHAYPFVEGHDGYAFKCVRNECTLDDIGLNSAASDIYYLYHAMLAHYQDGDDSGLMSKLAEAVNPPRPNNTPV